MTKSDALTMIAQGLPQGWIWIPLLSNVAGSFILGIVTALIAVACTRHRTDATAPWHEAARRSFPRRSALALTCVATPIAAGVFGYMLTSPLSIIPPAGIALVNVIAATAGLAVLSWRFSKEWQSDPAPITYRQRCRHLALFALMRLFPLCPPLLAYWFLPTHPGPMLWLGITLLIAGSLIAASGAQIHLAVKLKLLTPASDRLAAAVARAETRCGTRAHGAYECDMLMANAFAFVWTGDLLFTRRLVDLLDDAELESVALHELAHVAEPLRVRILRSGLAPLICALGLARVVYEHWGYLAMAAMFVVPLLGILIGRRVAHRMEHHADAAARPTGDDSLVYASALEKLYQYNAIPVVLAGRAVSHPHLYDRLLTAGATPDYPRPSPPVMKGATLSHLLNTGLLIGLFAGGQLWAFSYSYPGRPVDRAAITWLLVLRGDHWDFQTVGVEDYEADNLNSARAHLTVARSLDPSCDYCAYYLGLTLVESGHCREASEVSEACTAIAATRDVPQNVESARYLRSLIADCVPVEERPRP